MNSCVRRGLGLFLPALMWCAEVGQKVGPVELETFDGRKVVLSNYKGWRATAVLFLSTRWAEAEATTVVVNELNRKFRLREVLLVGVFANAEESGEEVRTFAQRSGFLFPFHRDPEGKAARLLKAQVTGEAFLINRDGVLVYAGAIGKSMDGPGLGKAIAAVIANQPVERTAARVEGSAIGKGAPKREVVDPYGSIWFASELIFERIEKAPAHHASTIVEAANGDLLAVWYGGSYESSDDEKLFLARRRKGERVWDAPQALLQDSLQPPGNAVVFRDGADRIWIVWGKMEAPRPLRRGSGWDQCRLLYRVSADNGRTWTEDRVLVDALGTLPRNVPITLGDGTLLLPLSGRLDNQSGSFFLMTKNNGETWRHSAVIPGGSQPTVVERRDGTLFTMLRGRPRIQSSESKDGGLSWSAPVRSELKNPGAGIAMTALRNGNLVLVYNDSENERTPLSIARSTDGGKTWEQGLKLEANPGEYSYPCVIQTADGRIHVTYTYRRYSIKHVELDEGWLVHTSRPD